MRQKIMRLLAGATIVGLAFLAAHVQTASAEQIVKRGAFHNGPHAPAHVIKGAAEVVKLDNGRYEVRLSNDFFSDEGPDVVVLLSRAPDATDDRTILDNAMLQIGKRKALTGKQGYPLPASFKPEEWNSVVVWCKQFDVQFGAAPLK